MVASTPAMHAYVAIEHLAAHTLQDSFSRCDQKEDLAHNATLAKQRESPAASMASVTVQQRGIVGVAAVEASRPKKRAIRRAMHRRQLEE